MMHQAFPQLFNHMQQDDSRTLASFKAGLMNLEPRSNNKFWITPDLRKGQIEISREHSGLFVLHWRNRGTNSIEKTMHLVPGVASIKRANTGRDKDRVYYFQFSNSSNYLFFWMQDKSDSKDEDIFKKIDDSLKFDENQLTSGVFEDPLTAAIRNTQRSFVAPAAPTQPNVVNQSAQIQDILRSLGQPPTNPTNAQNDMMPPDLQRAMQGIVSALRPQQRVSLNQVLNPDEIMRRGILDDPEVQARLLPLLPPELQTTQELIETIRSPQFQQSVAALEHALETNNFDTIMSNFGLDPSVATNALYRGDVVEVFLEALIAQAQQRQNTSNEDENDSEKEKKMEEN